MNGFKRLMALSFLITGAVAMANDGNIKYPNNNIDEVNARHILDRGYLYNRKAAFMKPYVTEETVTYVAPVADKPAVIKEKGKEVVQPEPTIIEEVVKTYKNYNNLQFAEVLGDWGAYSGSGSKYHYGTVGVTGATFHKFDQYPELMAGLAYGYAHSKVNYRNSLGSNEKLNTLGIDGFLSWTKDNWLATGSFGYAWTKHNLNRNFLYNDIPVQAGRKHFDSHQWNLGMELGYNYNIDPTFSVYPYVGFDYIWNTRDSDRAHDFSFKKSDYDTGLVKVGAMAEKSYGPWTVTLDAAWKYYTKDYKTIDGKAFEDKRDFKGKHIDIGKSLGYVGVGVDYAVTPQLSVGVEYAGYYRTKQSDSLFGGNLTYKF